MLWGGFLFLLFIFFSPLSLSNQTSKETAQKSRTGAGELGAYPLWHPPFPLGVRLPLPTAAGAAVQALVKTDPLSHQASHEAPEIQICLIIYGFSLDVENIC